MKDLKPEYARRIAELGYNREGSFFCKKDDAKDYDADNVVVVPYLQQAQEWLREEKGIIIWITPHASASAATRYCAHVATKSHHNLGWTPTYDEALEKAVLFAIEYLERENEITIKPQSK